MDKHPVTANEALIDEFSEAITHSDAIDAIKQALQDAFASDKWAVYVVISQQAVFVQAAWAFTRNGPTDISTRVVIKVGLDGEIQTGYLSARPSRRWVEQNKADPDEVLQRLKDFTNGSLITAGIRFENGEAK